MGAYAPRFYTLGNLARRNASVAPASVYIVEERASVRNALADRLSQSADVTVLGHSGEIQVALEEIEECAPDAILVETKRSDGMGLEVLRRLSMLKKRSKIIVLTSYPTSWEEERAMQSGADAYRLKNIESEELIRLICTMVGDKSRT